MAHSGMIWIISWKSVGEGMVKYPEKFVEKISS
jgi:hypothetical protein